MTTSSSTDFIGMSTDERERLQNLLCLMTSIIAAGQLACEADVDVEWCYEHAASICKHVARKGGA